MGRKILLIDDSAILRRIATNVLDARAGCGEVITATRATEGFARACATGVDLVLVDYQIAGYPNADFCRRLLEEPRTVSVPVILLLGPGVPTPAQDILPGNIVAHLTKPFTPEQLLRTVQNVSRGTGTKAIVRPKAEIVPAPTVTQAPEALVDHHEVAVALSTAAAVRREAVHFSGTRRVLQREAPPTTRNVAAEGLIGNRPRGVTSLRDALVAASGRGTGVLRISATSGKCAEVYLDGGQIVVVATPDAPRYAEDVEDILPSKISAEALEDAIAEQAHSGIPFFLALGSCGLLSKSAAVTLLHHFGQRYFARLWAERPDGLTFGYEALDALPGFALRLEPRAESVEVWLLDAARNVRPEDLSVLQRHEGLRGVPWLHKAGTTGIAQLPLNDQERGFARLVDGRRGLAAVASGLDITPEHAFLLLYRFRCLGLMDYRAAGMGFVVTPRTSVRRVLPLQR